MPRSRVLGSPVPEPELRGRQTGSVSIGGATVLPEHGAHISGSSTREVDYHTSAAITLCDGTQVAFTRTAELRS
jgi:hypothetical protein